MVEANQAFLNPEANRRWFWGRWRWVNLRAGVNGTHDGKKNNDDGCEEVNEKPLIALWAFAPIRWVEMRATIAALEITLTNLDRFTIPIYHFLDPFT
jgi:hypothetical protein